MPGIYNSNPLQVADLLSGRYDDVISSFRLIDCRYPYEFEGGHVMVGQKQSNFKFM